MSTSDKQWVVKYTLPPDTRYRERIVLASNQRDAIRVAQAEMPSARIIGGPQQYRG